MNEQKLIPHFVELPRKYDRELVEEAFSISDDIFRQTFKFQKGDWLYISHEAAGLDATPVPIHANNAEKRLFDWLKYYEKD